MDSEDKDSGERPDTSDTDEPKPEEATASDTESDEEPRFVPTPYPRDPLPQPSTPAEDEAVSGVLAVPERSLRRAGRFTRRIALGLVSLLALGTTGYAYVTKDQLQSNVPTTNALSKADDPAAPPADDGATDILLVGSDARTDAQGNPLPAKMLKQLRTEEKPGVNTDTIIILRIPKTGGKPSGVSIPRDTWTDIPGRGKNKINSAYGVAKANYANGHRGESDQAKLERDSDQEGRKALVQTVQDLTQIRIDHYAEVNLLGFYLLTEALGGVKVCLNHATEDKDSGANFRRGEQVVSGGEALSFVRQRKNLPHGDLDRIVRQQTFLSSALNQVLSAGTLTSPSTMSGLMDVVHRSIVLDEGLDLLEFAQQAKGIASGDLTFTTIPVVNVNGRSEDGQSIVEIDPAAVRTFVSGLVGRGGGGGAPGAGPLLAASSVPCVN
ncbi:LCP family protein [Amycolatopsis regifaucium]|uniref:LytR family transcriptional regulator n=1 Tax=Amycolatopsis regifaucium TaxID=546365 RepID=A0A154MCJ0_9PSEU|nr:LCP family protein [Amycolatopsis regifaucium]KZB82314.1 LytR family transcriptional regulator [Amycolatopsis regifaucium]OKA10292.1 LytR family transcriptional regulator [Amycolatopsis regifaucium]SFG89562.1 cell envelope-related function transcriptional attenuator common domain-containing protein [Amycolatopsis regifaucium]